MVNKMREWPDNMREALMFYHWDFKRESLEEISIENTSLAFHEAISAKEREFLRFKYREEMSFEKIDIELGLEDGYAENIIVGALSRMTAYLSEKHLIEKGLFNNYVVTANLLVEKLITQTRIVNALKRADIVYIRDLCMLSYKELSSLRNLGPIGTASLSGILNSLGIITQVNELDKPYIVEMPTYAMSLSKKQANISDIKQ